MVDGAKRPGSDLLVVIRQAKERGFLRTAKAAEALATQRQIPLVPGVHFG